jgi:hypothetical protein
MIYVAGGRDGDLGKVEAVKVTHRGRASFLFRTFASGL